MVSDGTGEAALAAYLLPGGHPAADGRYEDGAQQDLSRVVDQQGDRDQREVLVACKHDLQHGDTWITPKHTTLSHLGKNVIITKQINETST